MSEQTKWTRTERRIDPRDGTFYTTTIAESIADQKVICAGIVSEDDARLHEAAPDMAALLERLYAHSCHRSEGRGKWSATDQMLHDETRTLLARIRGGE